MPQTCVYIRKPRKNVALWSRLRLWSTHIPPLSRTYHTTNVEMISYANETRSKLYLRSYAKIAVICRHIFAPPANTILKIANKCERGIPRALSVKLKRRKLKRKGEKKKNKPRRAMCLGLPTSLNTAKLQIQEKDATLGFVPVG